MSAGRQAVFLDKDGTVVPDIPYNANPALMELAPGASEGLRRLHEAGFTLVVVSNQSGIARGLVPESAMGAVEARLHELFRAAGAEMLAFRYCPHHPATHGPNGVDCACRKPRPGLLRQAAADFGLDLERSWMVGDILNDVEAGRVAGCRTVLIENGGETEWRFTPLRVPHFRAFDLAGAAACILEAVREEAESLQGRFVGSAR